MKSWLGVSTGFCAFVVGMAMVVPSTQAGDISKGKAAEFILATAKAARTVFVKDIVAKAKAGGVKPNEDWAKADHSIMLPAQFVKAVGSKITDFELGLVGTDPLYASNAPKTDAEKKALADLAAGKSKVVTFEDGGSTVGMSADFAIVQGCADCHNKHPKTAKKDWKKGDFMGAIVVRMK
ncbi:MAG: c-type heme family protein [Nitrospirales bacterium]